MSLFDTGQGLRRMQRSMRLRDMSDPKEVQATLEQILVEAIHMQNVGNRRYQQKALDELKQVRQDMVAGQVKGSGNEKFVGLYGHVIDQIEGLVSDNARTNSAFESGIGAIKNAIPSTDSLVAALMTANPLVGYGVKILRDVGRSRKENQKRQQEEAKQKLQVLKEEEAYVKSQLEAEGEDEEIKQDTKEVTKGQKREYTKGGIYREVLTQIRDEIRDLENLIKGLEDGVVQVDNTNLEQIESGKDRAVEQFDNADNPILRQIQSDKEDAVVDHIDNIGHRVDGVTDTILKQIESDKDNTVDQIDNVNDIEQKKERDSKLTRMKEDSPRGMPILENVEATSVKEDKGGGLFGLLGALRGGVIGAFFGLLSGIAGAMGPIMGGGMIKGIIGGITGLVKFVGVLGKGLLVLGAKLALPALVLTAIYGFFDGFFNAAEFLKKSDVNLGERILVGVANIFGLFGRIFDWLAEKMGFDFFDSTDLTKRIYDFFISIPNKVGEFFDSIGETISNEFNNALESVFGLAGKISGIFDRITSAIEGKIAGVKGFITDMPGLRWMFDDEVPTPLENMSESQSSGSFGDSSRSPLQMIDSTRGPGASYSNPASNAVKRAENETIKNNINNTNNVVNAPVSNQTNIQNNIVGGHPSTSNPNRGFREVQSTYGRF